MKLHRGSTVAELMVAAALMGVSVFLIAKVMSNVISAKRYANEYTETESQMMALHRQLIEVGRTSYGCRLQGTGIECDVSYSDTPGVGIVKVRFTHGGNAVVFTRDDGGGNFNLMNAYTSIQQFEICDDGLMTASLCSLEPRKISDRHVLDISAPPDPNALGRFFRFRMIGAVNIGQLSKTYSMQGAFFARNGGASAGEGTVRYGWGIRD